MSDWSLDLNGTRKTLSQWQLTGGSVQFNNLAVDQFSILRDGANFDADPLCAYGDSAKLYRPDGVKIFEGRRQLVPGECSGRHEAQGYLFSGPWQWLQQNLYKQLWVGGVGGVLTSLYTSHLIVSGTGTQIITRVLEYAIAQGAPVQIGVINIPVAPPITEIIDRTCATSILDCLQYAPDAAGWFDYSTSPPTFHCKQRRALTRVTLSIPPAATQAQVNVSLIRPIQARPDLQVPSVELLYEITNQVDGVTKHGLARDVYPVGATGREDGCLSSIVNLQGFSATHVRGTLNAASIQKDSVAWWARFFPWLTNDTRVFNVTVSKGANNVPLPATRIGTDGLASLGLPRYLLQDSATAAEWMINPDGSNLVWDEDLFTIEVDFDLYVDATRTEDVHVRQVKKQRLTVPLMTVNAPAGETDYNALETFEQGDPVPVALSQFLFDSLSTLHYDALIELTEAECSGLVNLGNVLNLAGSRPEFTTMDALVQAVTLNIDQGTTTIVSGPPKQLSLHDVLELLKANRVRRRWTNPATQSTGDLSGPSNVQMGRGTAGANSVPGQGITSFFAVRDGGNNIVLDAPAAKATINTTGVVMEGAGKVTIKDSAIVLDGGGQLLLTFGGGLDLSASNSVWTRQLTVVEVGVCVKNADGTTSDRKMQVIGAGPY
jgi:hypothetical protein